MRKSNRAARTKTEAATTPPVQTQAHAAELSAWSGLSQVPTGLRATVAAKAAGALFRRAARNLDVRIEYPDGVLIGADPDSAGKRTRGIAGADRDIQPRMIIRNP